MSIMPWWHLCDVMNYLKFGTSSTLLSFRPTGCNVSYAQLIWWPTWQIGSSIYLAGIASGALCWKQRLLAKLVGDVLILVMLPCFCALCGLNQTWKAFFAMYLRVSVLPHPATSMSLPSNELYFRSFDNGRQIGFTKSVTKVRKSVKNFSIISIAEYQLFTSSSI